MNHVVWIWIESKWEVSKSGKFPSWPDRRGGRMCKKKRKTLQRWMSVRALSDVPTIWATNETREKRPTRRCLDGSAPLDTIRTRTHSDLSERSGLPIFFFLFLLGPLLRQIDVFTSKVEWKVDDVALTGE